MTESIRSFIATEINDAVHKELSTLQDKLRSSGADVKWVAPESIHLTLKFLGYVDEEQLDKIIHILDDITSLQSPFYMAISGVGAFPKPSYPRVIWVGIEEGKDRLSNISQILEDRLYSMGFPKEDRPFSAHLTLGRARSPKGKDRLAKSILDSSFKSGQRIIVDHITLFKSTLTKEGSIYTILHKADFKGR